jgi:hypothetical protein
MHQIRPISTDVDSIASRQVEVMVYAHTLADSDEQRYVGSAFLALGRLMAASGGTAPAMVEHWVVNPALPRVPNIRLTVGASLMPAAAVGNTAGSDALHRSLICDQGGPAGDVLDGADSDVDDPSGDGSFIFTVDRAVQLPLICRTSERSKRTTKPNAYVTWSVAGDQTVHSTDVVASTTRPQWGHRHTVKLPPDYNFDRKLVFKVWHKPSARNASPGADPAAATDTLIGYATVDLHPLTVGFLEVRCNRGNMRRRFHAVWIGGYGSRCAMCVVFWSFIVVCTDL